MKSVDFSQLDYRAPASSQTYEQWQKSIESEAGRPLSDLLTDTMEIGRASCRERVFLTV